MLDFVKTQKEALETVANELDEESVSQFIRSRLLCLYHSLKHDFLVTEHQLVGLLDTIDLYSTPSQKPEVEDLRKELQSES